MNYNQATALFSMINVGQELGTDHEGNIVTADTKLGSGMALLGYRNYVPRTGQLPPKHTHVVDDAVKFLREWADALEGGPDGTLVAKGDAK